MEIAASLSMSRTWRLALAGALAAFAWIVLTLLLGFAPAAHAQGDDTDDKGLLGAVTYLVDSTAEAATGTVSAVTSEVVDVVDTVVSVAPAPVQQPVRRVVETVGTVLSNTTEPVADVVSTGVVKTVAKPVVETVTQVPIVGDVVTAVGLDDAVTDLAETTDRTLGGVVETVGGAGTTLAPGTPQPGQPGVPGLPASPVAPADSSIPVGGHVLPAPDAVLPGAVPADAASVLASLLAAYGAASAITAAPTASASASTDARDSQTPAGVLCPPSALSSGPGGAGPGAWALVALGPLVALRAWVRRAGPEDEHAPPAPSGSTDVSPD